MILERILFEKMWASQKKRENEIWTGEEVDKFSFEILIQINKSDNSVSSWDQSVHPPKP